MRLIIDNDKLTTTTHPVMPPTNGRLELMELAAADARVRDWQRRLREEQLTEDMANVAQRHRFGRDPDTPRTPTSVFVSWIIFLACTTLLGWGFFFYLADQVTRHP